MASQGLPASGRRPEETGRNRPRCWGHLRHQEAGNITASRRGMPGAHLAPRHTATSQVDTIPETRLALLKGKGCLLSKQNISALASVA